MTISLYIISDIRQSEFAALRKSLIELKNEGRNPSAKAARHHITWKCVPHTSDSSLTELEQQEDSIKPKKYVTK